MDKQTQISPERQRLLALRLKGSAKLPIETGRIPKRPEGQHAPLSFSQERLWILSQMEPDVANYHISRCWRIHGPLHREILERCLDEITRRHEILRTTFQMGEDGEPIQVVSAFRPRTLPFMEAPAADLEPLAAAESARLSIWNAALFGDPFFSESDKRIMRS